MININIDRHIDRQIDRHKTVVEQKEARKIDRWLEIDGQREIDKQIDGSISHYRLIVACRELEKLIDRQIIRQIKIDRYIEYKINRLSLNCRRKRSKKSLRIYRHIEYR